MIWPLQKSERAIFEAVRSSFSDACIDYTCSQTKLVDAKFCVVKCASVTKGYQFNTYCLSKALGTQERDSEWDDSLSEKAEDERGTSVKIKG